MGNYHDISALDTSNKGVDYYVAEAAAHRFHTLLMEAACRAKGVQLIFWSAGQVGCMPLGLQGPLYSIINSGRERNGLRGEPMVPFLEKAKRKIDSVAEHRNTTERRTPRQRSRPPSKQPQGRGCSRAPGSVNNLSGLHTLRMAAQAGHPASRVCHYVIPAFVREASLGRTDNLRDPFHRNVLVF
ncbi:unnamed protein product [Toxocara canis]|uniref:Short chain dehydrogenase n=1 Tax=Toxocara canis TaxID=6265 RepID=A0A183U4Q4_TOXCA|nr:unnamed protein product [Toxocara canis]